MNEDNDIYQQEIVEEAGKSEARIRDNTRFIGKIISYSSTK